MPKSDGHDFASTAELLPQHDEIYLFRRLLESLWIGTALTLIGYHMVNLVSTPSLRSSWILFVVLAGFFTADFLSGMIHWTADTWFSDTMPILGQRVLKPFRVHHVNPDDFLRRNFLDTNGDVAVLVIPFLIAVFWISTKEPWSAAGGRLCGLTLCGRAADKSVSSVVSPEKSADYHSLAAFQSADNHPKGPSAAS